MDKYEYNMKIDQLRQAVRKRDLDTALQVADEIDWKKEKDASALTLGADAYEINKKYDMAKQLLVMAYEKSQTGKSLAYRLALICAKTKEFDEALEFYHDFVDMAPRDTARYVLQYRIAKAKGESIDFLIEILEEYVELDMEEKWMYELAKLYHMSGEVEKCVDLCDEMSLWFNHGDYVRRAMDLKMKYRPLTKRQQENYNKTEEDVWAEKNANNVLEDAQTVQDAQTVKNEQMTGSTDGFESQLSKHGSQEEESVSAENTTVEKNATIPFTTMKVNQFRGENKEPQADVSQATENLEESSPNENTAPIPGEINIEDIHVKPFVGNGSDTIDIQAEIAKNIQEIMANDEAGQTETEEKTEEKAEAENLTMTLDPMFKYDANGQIGLDIEVPHKKEKQITGQLSIEEVLRNLEDRGILKADTVNKTVKTMDQAAEAANKAAEEAAVREENKKKNETVVQDLGVKDLAEDGEMAEVKLALESYADDAANGFVFTDEIDSEAIEKAMKDSEPLPIPDVKGKTMEVAADNTNTSVNDTKEVNTKEESATEKDILDDDKAMEELLLMAASSSDEADNEPKVKETPIELVNDIPVLDLSFEAPVKKIHPGIAPASKPVAANTASLKELFADLDEATKREIGLVEEEKEVSDVQLAEAVEKENTDVQSVETVEKETTDAQSAETVEKETTGAQSAETVEKEATDAQSVEDTEKESVETDVADVNVAKNMTADEKVETTDVQSETDTKSEYKDVKTENLEESTDVQEDSIEESSDVQTDSTEAKSSDVQTDSTEADSSDVQTDSTEAESLDAKAENAEEESTNAQSENAEAKYSDVQEEHTEVEASNTKEETTETDASEVGNTHKNEVEKVTTTPEGMPQVTTSINKNLTQTISLDIDKIVVSDEEMIPFESFKTVNGLEQKIKDTVTTLVAGYEGLGNSKTGNVMILGDDKSGKTTMAIELIKLINKKRGRTGRRIAKVDSSVLNTRGIRSSMKKLVGSDLIVENAQHLRKSVLQEFLAVGQYYTDNMLMVFEGETSAMKTMRRENEDITRMFDHILVIKEYDVKEWVAYAKKYAGTKNYMIDEMGTLALYKSIDDFYGKHQGIDQSDVENIINYAIKKASGKIGRKFTNLFSGKNDDSGMDILKEVDFK